MDGTMHCPVNAKSSISRADWLRFYMYVLHWTAISPAYYIHMHVIYIRRAWLFPARSSGMPGAVLFHLPEISWCT